MGYEAPQPRSTAPLVALRERLAVARRAGEEFGPAWVRIVDTTLAEIADSGERRQWKRALGRTVSTWQSAYAREAPARLDEQLALLGDD